MPQPTHRPTDPQVQNGETAVPPRFSPRSLYSGDKFRHVTEDGTFPDVFDIASRRIVKEHPQAGCVASIGDELGGGVGDKPGERAINFWRIVLDVQTVGFEKKLAAAALDPGRNRP